ncbi:hypothetical protein FRC07_002983, partial [Ceratobasidium sp. 392]
MSVTKRSGGSLTEPSPRRQKCSHLTSSLKQASNTASSPLEQRLRSCSTPREQLDLLSRFMSISAASPQPMAARHSAPTRSTDTHRRTPTTQTILTSPSGTLKSRGKVLPSHQTSVASPAYESPVHADRMDLGDSWVGPPRDFSEQAEAAQQEGRIADVHRSGGPENRLKAVIDERVTVEQDDCEMAPESQGQVDREDAQYDDSEKEQGDLAEEDEENSDEDSDEDSDESGSEAEEGQEDEQGGEEGEDHWSTEGQQGWKSQEAEQQPVLRLAPEKVWERTTHEDTTMLSDAESLKMLL